MRRLPWVSASTTFGTRYLDHCAEALRETLGRCTRVLFGPGALARWGGFRTGSASIAASLASLVLALLLGPFGSAAWNAPTPTAPAEG